MSSNGYSREKVRILIIDDDKDIRDVFAEILKRNKFTNLNCAGTGEEAISIFESEFHNVAIIDLKLPDIHGMDLISQLRTVSPDTEFIIVTGFGDLHTAIKALQFEVGGYLEKPISSEKLIRTLAFA